MGVGNTEAELQLQINDLQTRLTYQEDLLQSLNDVIANQDLMLSRLQHELQQNRQKLDEVAYSMEAKGSEKPPHY
ncbi:MAG: SlyX family protein [Cellvibrionaceae bacterium]